MADDDATWDDVVNRIATITTIDRVEARKLIAPFVEYEQSPTVLLGFVDTIVNPPPPIERTDEDRALDDAFDMLAVALRSSLHEGSAP